MLSISAFQLCFSLMTLDAICYNPPMAELKTQKTTVSPSAFIDTVQDPQRKADAKKLLAIFKNATGMKPAMWGAAIVQKICMRRNTLRKRIILL